MLICGSHFLQYEEPKTEYNAQNGSSEIFWFKNLQDVEEIFWNNKLKAKMYIKINIFLIIIKNKLK